MRNQLAGADNPAEPPQPRVIDQTGRLLRQQLIQVQRRARVVGLDVGIDRPPIVEGFRRLRQPHEPAPVSFRRVSARRAANSASTASADTSRPALAESIPI